MMDLPPVKPQSSSVQSLALVTGQAVTALEGGSKMGLP